MKELSIFVDESGDFGSYSSHSPYYLFALVLHDQSDGIEQAVAELDNKIDEHGFPLHAIHSGPIIRNEGFYKNYDSEDRNDYALNYLNAVSEQIVAEHNGVLDLEKARDFIDGEENG